MSDPGKTSETGNTAAAWQTRCEANGLPLSHAAILRVLEEPPVLPVAEDFASRVAALAVAQPLAHRSLGTGFGLRTALICGVLLTLALFVVAAHARPSFWDLGFDMELLLLAELGFVAWVATRLWVRD